MEGEVMCDSLTQTQQTEEEQHLPIKQDRGQTHPQLGPFKDLCLTLTQTFQMK